MGRIKRKDNVWRQLFGVFFLLGAVFAFFLVNGMENYFQERAGIFSEYNLRQIKYQEYDSRRLFVYFFGKRMKWAVLLLVLACFRMTAWGLAAFSGWIGFSMVYLGGIAVLKFGFRGIVLFFLAMFPQEIFYLWGAGILFCWLWKWETEGNYWEWFPGKKLAMAFGILLLGILTESYVNQSCLKLVYRLL